MGAPLAVHGLAIATAACCIVVAVCLTFECMVRLGRAYGRRRGNESRAVGRLKVLRLVLGLVLMHALNIGIFGLGYWGVLQVGGAGTIHGTVHSHASVFDAFYLSATTYATTGYGDLAPNGPIRWLAGSESLVGLMLVAWSASFAFMEMSRHWRNDLR